MILTPHKGILELKAYNNNKSTEKPKTYKIELLRNEGPLGASPKAIDAIKNIHHDVIRTYSDLGYGELREAIAGAHNLNPSNIVCGAGSDELLGLLMQAYVESGDDVVYNEQAFVMYQIYTLANGGRPITVPKHQGYIDVDATIAAVTEKTKIVILANPDNPTGTYLPKSELIRLRENLPTDVLLIIDSAYAEFANHIENYSAGAELVDTYENTVMTRTFSKAYGLAGLRLGWSYAPANISSILNRLRNPFNISSITEAAGIAAVSDHEFLQKSLDYNKKWLAKMSEHFKGLGLELSNSVANFVYITFPENNPNKTADTIYNELKNRDILVRELKNYGLDNVLRINVGIESEMETLFAEMTDIMKN
ncbi:MAG: histidinol-phosphate transaminase [Alphaproteobacteria bacterium]|nr:histidinol-phosphate transaminase [Alphaproteobacteria bacterium]